jgi:predicted nucleotidyltransferase component of viral defense system
MIKKNEINRIALEKNVTTSIIDKDWALGHFIDAIYSIEECRENLLFKGGTCLRKCRFPDYRFSEDLDFTAKDQTFVLDSHLLEKITALITKRTGMPLHIVSIETLRFKDRLTGYAAHVKFWGADHRAEQQPPEPSRWTSNIKIETILYEKMIFAPEERHLYHPYSDTLSSPVITIPCYDIKETLAEKIRALVQRSYTAPRDYYDIWYISRNVENIDWKEVVMAFHGKMACKGLCFTGVEQLLNDANDQALRTAWKRSLEHQITQGSLPSYDTVKEDLQILFTKIFTISE